MKHTNLLTQADRDMFDRIDRDCLAMHVVPPPKTFVELSVKDGAGVEVERYTDRAHSWVRNTYNGLASLFLNGYDGGGVYGPGDLCAKYENGSISGSNRLLSVIPAMTAGQNTGGIIVGSGDSAESFESFSLANKINHGSTAGLLSYGDGSDSRVYDPYTKKWTATVIRVLNNNSGNSVTIREVGICGQDTAYGYLLLSRDLLASPVTVPNGGQLTVTYTIEMTFPG